MKRKISIVIALIVCLIFSAIGLTACNETAEDEIYDGSTGLTFTYRSWMDGYIVSGCDKTATEIAVPSEFNKKAVTRIGENAFEDCTSLESVVLPDSITDIGSNAFSGCTSLESIVLPSGLTKILYGQFSDCISLKSVDFGENSRLDTIGKFVFSGCTGLESIVLPESLTSIGEGAFLECSSLSSINIPSKVERIERLAFCHCGSLTSIEIGSGVEYIGEGAFSACNSLTMYCEAESKQSGWHSEWNTYLGDKPNKYVSCPVVWDCKNNTKDENGYEYAVVEGIRYRIKDGVATVVRQPSALSGNAVIVSEVTYNDDVFQVTDIADYAFYRCESLAGIEIPNSIVSIGYQAFYCCFSLVDIEIPSSVAYIGGGAFYACVNIKSITVASGNTNYYSSGNCLIETDSNVLIYGCKNSVVPNDITHIGSGAFYACTGLVSIEIPAGVMRIGNGAFLHCIGLESVIFENEVGWRVKNSEKETDIGVDVADSLQNAVYLTETYIDDTWIRTE